MSVYHITISIPKCLDRILAAPLILLRKIWYGYAFRRISLVNSKLYAIIDPADYHRLSQYPWWVYKKRKFVRIIRLSPENASYRIIALHRQILKSELNAEPSTQSPNSLSPEPSTLPPNLVVDHINRNGLDNRRANLRLVTIAQNNMNRRPWSRSSKFKGVSFHKNQNRFIARITVNGKRLHLGSFINESAAAKAYDKAALEHFGQFAYLNFPKYN